MGEGRLPYNNTPHTTVMAKAAKAAQQVERPKTQENVFLFVPNLIGYARVILAGISLIYMSYHPKYCTLLYGISSLLDAVDGQAARALGQSSRFGAVLDMVTDRCATTCLLCFLSFAYPKWALLFQFLITLDFSSHYIHMYSSLVTGSKSHKSVTKEQSRILWSYYNNSRTLFFFCACNEIFFVALYLIQWYPTPLGIHTHHLLKYLPKEVILRIPLGVIRFVETTLTWPYLLAAITFPVCLGKQIINCVQFWKAAKALTDLDREERYIAQQAKTQ